MAAEDSGNPESDLGNPSSDLKIRRRRDHQFTTIS